MTYMFRRRFSRSVGREGLVQIFSGMSSYFEVRATPIDIWVTSGRQDKN